MVNRYLSGALNSPLGCLPCWAVFHRLLMQLFLDIEFEGLDAENNLCLSCVLFPPMFIENENDERVRVTFSQKKVLPDDVVIIKV